MALQEHILNKCDDADNNVGFIKETLPLDIIIKKVTIIINNNTENNIKILFYSSPIFKKEAQLHIYLNDFDIILDTLNKLMIYNLIKEVTILNIYNVIKENEIVNTMIKFFPNIKELSFLNNTNCKDIINTHMEHLTLLKVCNIYDLPLDIGYYFSKLESLTIIINNKTDILHLDNLYNIKVKNIHLSYDTFMPPSNDDVNINLSKLVTNDLDILNINVDRYTTIDMKNIINEIYNINWLNISNGKLLNIKEIANFKNTKYMTLYDNNIIINPNDNLSLSSDKLITLNITNFTKQNNYFNDVNLNLPELTELTLSYCLNNEPILNNCRNIKYLDLSFNKLTSLSANIFLSLPNLEKFVCNYNNIENISTLISSCKKLTNLYIKHNNIKLLPEHLETLHELDCSNNPLITIDNIVFRNIHNIKINNTNIERINLNTKYSLKELEHIYCNMDKMKYISENLRDYIKNNK